MSADALDGRSATRGHRRRVARACPSLVCCLCSGAAAFGRQISRGYKPGRFFVAAGGQLPAGRPTGVGQGGCGIRAGRPRWCCTFDRGVSFGRRHGADPRWVPREHHRHMGTRPVIFRSDSAADGCRERTLRGTLFLFLLTGGFWFFPGEKITERGTRREGPKSGADDCTQPDATRPTDRRWTSGSRNTQHAQQLHSDRDRLRRKLHHRAGGLLHRASQSGEARNTLQADQLLPPSRSHTETGCCGERYAGRPWSHSALALALSFSTPRSAVVVIEALGHRAPRAIMHRCWLLTLTATPNVATFPSIASATCAVRRSWI